MPDTYMRANDLIGRLKRLAARIGWQIRKVWGKGSRGGPAAEDYAPIEEDPNSEIDIHVIKLDHRDTAIQRRTGLYTASMIVQVVHTLGSFELTFQTEQAERLPHTDTEILEFARRKVVQFADVLKVARIQIPKPSPDQHSALTSANAVRAEIIGFMAPEGSNDVCLYIEDKAWQRPTVSDWNRQLGRIRTKCAGEFWGRGITASKDGPAML